MQIDDTNYHLADDVVRGILFMYRDMVESYAGFGSDTDSWASLNSVAFRRRDSVASR